MIYLYYFIINKMIDIDLESIDKKYSEVIDEVNEFRDSL